MDDMDELGPIGEGVDWRTRVSPEIRRSMELDLFITLEKALAATAPPTLVDLQKVAAGIEERMHTLAIDYGDYLRRICVRKCDFETICTPNLVCQQPYHQQALLAREHNFVTRTQELNRSSEHVKLYLLNQQNSGDKHNQTIQAKGNVQGSSSSSTLYNQVLQSSHKEPWHPCEKDRISDLPDDLICHIMSSLSMREAVCTSVLSHRWLNMWSFLPCVELDIEWFHKDREQFSRFIDNLLIRRDHVDAPMDTFQLHSFAIDRANSWINHAIKHNVQVLKFAEYIKWEPFHLDPEVVTFSSEYLKTLQLTNVALCASVLDQLKNSCPSLENLLMIECLLDVQEISSSSLKNLGIIDCCLLMDLIICTPSLVSLSIEDRRSNDSSYRNSYLTTASVTLVDASNVKSMNLSAILIEVTFLKQAGRRTMFKNLTSLCLGGWCLVNVFSPLFRYIKHSPILKKLTLQLDLEEVGYHRIGDLHLKLHSLRAISNLEIDIRFY